MCPHTAYGGPSSSSPLYARTHARASAFCWPFPARRYICKPCRRRHRRFAGGKKRRAREIPAARGEEIGGGARLPKEGSAPFVYTYIYIHTHRESGFTSPGGVGGVRRVIESEHGVDPSGYKVYKQRDRGGH